MYYPKSHITPNLYSNGDLTLKGSLNPYFGHYFSTIDGKAFTGRNIGDGKNLELILPSITIGDPDTEFMDRRFYTSDSNIYSKLKGVDRNSFLPTKPTPAYPKPTQSDYQTGEFTRYFSKKSNESIYYETSALFENNYYIGFSLPWSIKGDKQKVAQTNKNIIELREREYSIIGLGAFLKFNYLQFHR